MEVGVQTETLLHKTTAEEIQVCGCNDQNCSIPINVGVVVNRRFTVIAPGCNTDLPPENRFVKEIRGYSIYR